MNATANIKIVLCDEDPGVVSALHMKVLTKSYPTLKPDEVEWVKNFLEIARYLSRLKKQKADLTAVWVDADTPNFEPDVLRKIIEQNPHVPFVITHAPPDEREHAQKASEHIIKGLVYNVRLKKCKAACCPKGELLDEGTGDPTFRLKVDEASN